MPLKRYLLSAYRFINARRRIVQPMIDQSNRAGNYRSYSKLNQKKKKNLHNYEIALI